jgi:transketolase
VGPDGATHQALEDIALMKVLPNMIVEVPCDYYEAMKATVLIAENRKPSYLRLERESSISLTTVFTDLEIGKAYTL